MAIKLILDVNKTGHAQLNYIVTGRVGDRASNVVDVYTVDGGTPYALTGLSIFYECLKPDNTAVRDNKGIKIVDAAKGHFEYTFPAEVFSAVGKAKQSFFSIEKDKTVRATTQDFLLVSLPNATDGHLPSETYISDLEKLINEWNKMVSDLKNNVKDVQKKADDLKKQIDTMNVVKKTGDTMTGTLLLSNAALRIRDKEDKEAVLLYNGSKGASLQTNTGKLWMWNGISGGGFVASEDKAQMQKITLDDGSAKVKASTADSDILEEVIKANKGFHTVYAAGISKNLPTNYSVRGFANIHEHESFGYIVVLDQQNRMFTNYINDKKGGWTGWIERADASKVVSKTGDTMSGNLNFSGSSVVNTNGSGIVQGGGKDAIRWRMYQSGNGECAFAPSTTPGADDWDWNKAFRIKPDGTVKQPTDTNWTNVTIINGAENQPNKTSKVRRSGDTVCLTMNVNKIKNNHIIATLPANFRPVDDLKFSGAYVLKDLDTTNGIITIRKDGSVHCEWIAEGTNPLSFWSFTITYMI